MKLTFLGTSHGVPMTTRFCSAALVEIGDAAYLIDGGAPVGDLLIRRGIPYEKIRAVFATHMHSDHTAGLLGFISLSNWKFKNSSYEIFLPEQIGIDAFREAVRVMDERFDDSRLRFRLVQEGVVYSDDNLTVSAFRTRHMEGVGRPTFAYVLDTADGKRLVMTGDLHGGDAADFPEIAQTEPSDAIVCEMAHFNHDVIFPIVAACPTKRVLFNHVFRNYEENMAAIREAEKTLSLGVPVHAAEDGESFEL